MTNESQLSQRQTEVLGAVCRGGVIVKTSDRATHALPDKFIAWMGYTCWIENKFLRPGRKLKDIVKHGQVILGHQLSTCTNGRAWIVVYQAAPMTTTIWTPRAIGHQIWPRVVLAGADDSVATTRPADYRGLYALLRHWGGVTFIGFDHMAVAELVKQACLAP